MIFILADSTLEEKVESFMVSLVSVARNPDPEFVHLVNASAQVLINDKDGECIPQLLTCMTHTISELFLQLSGLVLSMALS